MPEVLASALGYFDSAVDTIAFAEFRSIRMSVCMIINLQVTLSQIMQEITITTTTTISHSYLLRFKQDILGEFCI